MEQRLSTTPKAIKEIFGAMPRSRIALEICDEKDRIVTALPTRSNKPLASIDPKVNQ